MEPREYKERFCMTHGGWCIDTDFVLYVTRQKGKKIVRLECPDCARKRKERAERANAVEKTVLAWKEVLKHER